MGARMIPYASIFAKRTGRYVFCRYCALPCTRAMAVACVLMRIHRALNIGVEILLLMCHITEFIFVLSYLCLSKRFVLQNGDYNRT